MSIKTNHSQETLTPESGILKVIGTGALKLPAGGASERPGLAVAGYLRFANDTTKPEYYDGAIWQILPNKSYVDNATASVLLSVNASLAAEVTNLTLDDLADVTTSGVSDGQVIAYDASLGEFRTQTQALTVINRYFIGNDTSLNFDIVTTVPTMNNLVVSVDGIQQEPSYSFTLVNGHIVSFDEAPEDGARILVKILKSTTSTDRARPTVTDVSYGIVGAYTTITITATDITYGTGAKIGDHNITRIDYISSNIMQLMVETTVITASYASPWSHDLTLIDTNGNEFVFSNLIRSYPGANFVQWTGSNSYIGAFSIGEAINFAIGVNNSTSITISPAYAGEASIGWLSISGTNIVGTAPNNSSPSRYEITVTASDGSVEITKNFWLLVI